MPVLLLLLLLVLMSRSTRPNPDAYGRCCSTLPPLLLVLLRIPGICRNTLLLLLPLAVQHCVQRVRRVAAAVQGCVQPLL